MSLRARVWALALLAASCTLPTRRNDQIDALSNTCTVEGEEQGECGPQGVCLRGRCHALDADDLPIVLAVTPSQAAGISPAHTYNLTLAASLLELRALDQSGGLLALGLPPLASLDISLRGPAPSPDVATSARGCIPKGQATNFSLPARVTVRPSAAMLGLQAVTYAQNTAETNGLNDSPRDILTTFRIPPATYDLYLESTGDPDCPFPPLLRPDVPVTGAVNVLDLALPVTSRLQGLASAPPGLDLSAWTVQIVEPRTGLRVSTVARLLDQGGGQWSIGIPYAQGIDPLEYYRPLGPTGSPVGSLFVVLSPPSSLSAPRFAWDLATLDLFGSGEIALDLSLLSLDTVDVELRVEQGGGPAGQKAQVWLSSRLTPGALSAAPSGAIASLFLGPRTTHDDGTLSARVWPGLYDVQAVALSSTATDPLPMTLDQGRKSLDFSPDPANPGATLAGFTLGLSAQPSIDIEVLSTNSGELVTGLPFELTSSVASPGSLGTLFGRFDVAPRGASGLTASDGHLRTAADSGTYNLTVRFPESSGFPWLVKPRVTLPLAESGSLRVSLPVEVNGTAFDLPLGGPRGNPLVGARIQAFALSGGTYVPVATTTVDARGSYRLLLPSRLLRLRSRGSPRIDSRFVPKDRPEQAPSPVETDLPGALHEVSNALTVVVGWLDRALSAPLDPELRRALIIAHARALDGRDIARSAIGARALSSVQQTMASLLDEAILGVLPEASSRGVHVTLRPLTGAPVLLDDARVLLQILTNLLLNAVAFSPADGTVEVTARTEQGDALIRVSDEGPGLPAERRANLFERGHSTRDGGAGVGLAHARDLAHQHGGELLLEESDRGASFSLRWPCAPTRSSASLIPRPSVALRGRRVLLVEDDGAIVELLDIALSARGAEVIAVSDASALSAALRQGPIDLVLLDWSPIAADARTHLAAVQAAFPGAPLVAISGSAALSDTDVLSLCAAWVRKPFELTELLGAVAAALASRA